MGVRAALAMQAAMTVSQAIRTDAAAELCAEIAAGLTRLGTIGPGTIEIVTAAANNRALGGREPM